MKDSNERQNRDIKAADEVKREAFVKLNRELKHVKLTFKKEKGELLKDHQADVKHWREELDEKTKIDTELKEKLTNLENENMKLRDVYSAALNVALILVSVMIR